MIIAVVLLLPGGIAGFSMYTRMVLRPQQVALPHTGVETTGEITRVFGDRSRVYWVSYNFEANGTIVSGEAQVPRRLLRTVEDSKTLTVRYLPGKPAVNFPAAWTPPPGPSWVLPIISEILMVAYDVWLLRMAWIQRKLIAQGVPAPEVVTKCTRRRKGWYRVSYEFRTAGGIMTEGKGWYGSRLETGAKVWALYLAQNPKRSGPYPLIASRVAPPRA